MMRMVERVVEVNRIRSDKRRQKVLEGKKGPGGNDCRCTEIDQLVTGT